MLFFYRQENFISEDKEVPPSTILSSVLDLSIEEMKEKYSVFATGIGLGGEYNSIGLLLEIHTDKDLNELRNIALECWEILKVKLNSCEDLKPYLSPYPFSPCLRLFIRNTDGSKNYDPQVCIVRITENEVEFCTNDPEDRFGYKREFTESMKEALAKNEAYLLRQESNQDSNL